MGQGGSGDRPVSAPEVGTGLPPPHREEGLDTSEAGFTGNRLWVPEFLNSCPVPTGRCEFLAPEAGPAQTLASP